MLDFYENSVSGTAECLEEIYTIIFLDYGKPLRLSIVYGCYSLSVDTVKDLEFVESIIKKEIESTE